MKLSRVIRLVVAGVAWAMFYQVWLVILRNAIPEQAAGGSSIVIAALGAFIVFDCLPGWVMYANLVFERDGLEPQVEGDDE